MRDRGQTLSSCTACHATVRPGMQAVADAHKHIAQLTSQLKSKSEAAAGLEAQLRSTSEEAISLAAQLEAAQIDAKAAKDTVTAERENAAILEAARAAAVKVCSSPSRIICVPGNLSMHRCGFTIAFRRRDALNEVQRVPIHRRSCCCKWHQH